MIEMEPGALKHCCASAYAHPLVSLVLGDAWHPGGRDLTRRLGQLLALSPKDVVVDVAAGQGTSACLLAAQFGCRVQGIDYGATQVAKATERAAREGLSQRVTFVEGDAEVLPLADNSADAVVCECALCTFPDPERAVREWSRILRPGGRVGLADVTRQGALPEELDGLAGWVGCLAGARSLEDYRDLLASEGFEVRTVEDRSEDLAALAARIGQALSAWLQFQGPKAGLPWSPEDVRNMVDRVSEAVSSRRLGYGLLTGWSV